MIDPINITPVGGGTGTGFIPAGRSPQSTGPCITQQPQVKAVSNDFSFYVEILTQGEGTTYQWQSFNSGGSGTWDDINGETNNRLVNPSFATYEFNNVANSYPAAYRCLVTRSGVTIASNEIQVNGALILDPPTGGTFGTVSGEIHMTPQITTSSGSLILGIGYAPVGSTWQWYRNGVALDEGINDGSGDPGVGGSSGTFTEEAVCRYDHVGIAGSDPVTGPEGTYTLVITAPNGIRTASQGAVWTAL